jgi:hypothetical protein
VEYDRFSCLSRQQTLMRIWITNNINVATARRPKVALRNLPRHPRRVQCKLLAAETDLWEHDLFIAGSKMEDGDFRTVATQEPLETPLSDNPERDLAHRNAVRLPENLRPRFRCLTDTQFHRKANLMASLVPTFSWVHPTSECFHVRNLIKIKEAQEACTISTLRHDLHHLHHSLLNRNDARRVSPSAQTREHQANQFPLSLALAPEPGVHFRLYQGLDAYLLTVPKTLLPSIRSKH